MPYYEPILFQEPVIGSGVMMLAAASCFPAWAVRMNLVRFFDQDLDSVCVRMAKIDAMLYRLNNYAMKLAEAVAVVMEAYQQRDWPDGVMIPGSAREALEVVKLTPTPPIETPELTFESLFRTAAGQMATPEVVA